MYRTSTYSQANTIGLHISYLFFTKACPTGGTRQTFLSNCKRTHLSECLDSKYLVLKHLGKVKIKILVLLIKCQLGECFLKNIMVSSYQEFKGNNKGEDISFYSQIHRSYATTHTVQERLDTPGISSLYDMGEIRHRNRISFLHGLRKNLYTH